MKFRKIVSLTAMLAFALMLITSIILYIVPQGRIAYWSDWRLWGLSKSQWGNLHINLGFLFLFAIGLHIYYNWKPLLAYLKNKSRQLKILTPEFNVALLVVLVCTLGTYLMMPPFRWVMDLNDHLKDSAALKYGEPPYGHAELSSLETFSKKLNLDLQKSLALLDEAGYRAESAEMTLAQVAREYRVTPQTLYQTIRAAAPKKKDKGADDKAAALLPANPPPGTGMLTLSDLSVRYDLDLKLLIGELKRQGIEASGDQTLREIAGAHQMGPADIYEAIKAGVSAGM